MPRTQPGEAPASSRPRSARCSLQTPRGLFRSTCTSAGPARKRQDHRVPFTGFPATGFPPRGSTKFSPPRRFCARQFSDGVLTEFSTGMLWRTSLNPVGGSLWGGTPSREPRGGNPVNPRLMTNIMTVGMCGSRPHHASVASCPSVRAARQPRHAVRNRVRRLTWHREPAPPSHGSSGSASAC